jgi:hypothetical protein
MELTARQIDALAQIKIHGPGTPEALAALAVYEEEKQKESELANLHRQVGDLQRTVAGLLDGQLNE